KFLTIALVVCAVHAAEKTKQNDTATFKAFENVDPNDLSCDPEGHVSSDTVASVRPISPILGRYNGIINCNRADAAARQVPYK
ncbi:hypothetical protein HF086_004218, partial [Spodoptera exigua]